MTYTPSPAALAKAREARSTRPKSEAFKTFIQEGWAPARASNAERADVADFAAARRAALAAFFPGDRLVIPAGPLKVRSNDTDYRFRPHSAFAHLTGLGADQEPDAVLVIEPGGDATLYFRPASGRESEEFYSNARYGEFWVGPRPTLDEIAQLLGLETRHLDDLRDALAKDVGAELRLRVIPAADDAVEALVADIRAEAGVVEDSDEESLTADEELDEAASELRTIKDAWEIEQMRLAVAATKDGFERVIAELARARSHARGERVVEAAFDGNAREQGNAVGYETIAAGGEHATTLHWIRNDGAIRSGELLLLDAGVEVDSLYTADITRTLPVSGAFTKIQRTVYQAVLDAADAAFEAARIGVKLVDVHLTALRVIAERLDEWGILPVSLDEALSEEGQQHRRWMVHGTSHHLGLDVHDCAQARREMYLDRRIEPGMCFTIEPGLYFKSDDLLVPEEFRGIGVRVEDDIVITASGPENLSAGIPRTPDAVEEWMARLM